MFDILYNGIAYEYNILADPEIKLSQERFEYKIQSITTQYQAIAELNVSDEDNRRIEALIYKVMALIQQ